MTLRAARLACIACLGLAAALSCRADSFTSSASSAGSASVGSLSDSIRGSSNSSSGKPAVAEGDYEILEVSPVAEAAGMLRLTLHLHAAAPDSAGNDITLDLPQRALGSRGLARGEFVTARARPYGIEFARTDTREAFFLALADDWKRELDPHPVAL